MDREEYAKVYRAEIDVWNHQKLYQEAICEWHEPAKKGFFHEVESIKEIKPKRKPIKPRERYRLLKEAGGKCVLCGATAKGGAQLVIDHIKPFSLHPELDFDTNNKQVLCSDCNNGKHNNCEIDWR
tara:strand:+ start:3340 stop:3717 length:378 start_codon:yes stop_codon:yes gene_type:complete